MGKTFTIDPISHKRLSNLGETLEDGRIEPYTIRFICKNGTEINCKDKFTATNDNQHSNNTATREKQHIWLLHKFTFI